MKSSYSILNDGELIKLLKKDDELAYTEIYNRYWDKIYHIAYIKLKDFYLAEEILQEVFLDFWRRRYFLTVKDNLSAYLFVALKNRIINARIKQSTIDRNLNEFKNYQNEHNYYSLEDQLNYEELKAKLHLFIQDLPEKCKLVYKLSREEGFTQKQISEELQISEKAVEANLTRALKKIRSRLKIILLILNTIHNI